MTRKGVDLVLDVLSARTLMLAFLGSIFFILWHRGNILWCISICLIAVLFYYILTRYFGVPPQNLKELQLDDLIHVEGLESKLQIVLDKWRALGAIPILKDDLDLINFLYAIKAWRLYDNDAYTDLLTLISGLLEAKKKGTPNSARVSIRSDIFQTYKRFSAFQGYMDSVDRLGIILQKYVDD